MQTGLQRCGADVEPPLKYQFVLVDGTGDLNPTQSSAVRRHAATVGSRRRNDAERSKSLASAARRIAVEGWSHKQDSSSEEEESKRDNVIAKHCRAIQQYRAKSARIALRLGSTDPFNAFCVHLDGLSKTLLRFALDNSVPMNFRVELLATGKSPKEHWSAAHSQQRIRSCILGNNQTDTYALLASAASIMGFQSSGANPLNQAIACYMGKAISSLRTQVNLAVSDQEMRRSIMIPVFNLMYVEVDRGDLEAARAHAQVLMSLCTNKIQGNFMFRRDYEELCYSDVRMAPESDSMPALHGTQWQPPQLSPDILTKIQAEAFSPLPDLVLHGMRGDTEGSSLRSVGNDGQLVLKSFQSPRRQCFEHDLLSTRRTLLTLLVSFTLSYNGAAVSELISTDMCTIINMDFKPWTYMMIWSLRHIPDSASEWNARWLDVTSVAILHKLLSLSRPSATSLGWREYLEDAFRLTLITLLAQIGNSRHSRLAEMNLRRIQSALERMATVARFTTNTQMYGVTDELIPRTSPSQARLCSWILQVCLTFTDSFEDYKWFDARWSEFAGKQSS